MSLECEFCKKKFSTQSNLTVHKKTAKYCIEIQKKQLIPDDSNTSSDNFICSHCSKEFTTKSNLNTHLGSCRMKQEYDRLEQQRMFYEKEMDGLRISYEKELELHKQEIKFLKEQLAEKKSEISDMKIELSTHKQVVYNDNSTYNIQFNEMLEKLLPCTDENIMKQFGQIPTNLIVSDIDKMEEVFISYFTKHMAPLAFCTDASRGKLVTKSEDGKPVKHMAEKLVLDFIRVCRKEVNTLIHGVKCKITQDFDEEKIDSTEYNNFYLQYSYLHDYLKTHNNTVTPYIKRLANMFSRGCLQLTNK